MSESSCTVGSSHPEAISALSFWSLCQPRWRNWQCVWRHLPNATACNNCVIIYFGGSVETGTNSRAGIERLEKTMDKTHFRARIEAEQQELRMLSDAGRESRAPVMLDQQSVSRLSRMDAMQQQSMDLAREERRKARSQCWRRRCVVLMRMSLAIVLPVVSMSPCSVWRLIRLLPCALTANGKCCDLPVSNRPNPISCSCR